MNRDLSDIIREQEETEVGSTRPFLGIIVEDDGTWVMVMSTLADSEQQAYFKFFQTLTDTQRIYRVEEFEPITDGVDCQIALRSIYMFPSKH